MAWGEVFFRTKWHLHPSSRLATIDMGRKLGGGGCAPPPFLGGAGFPSNNVACAEAYQSTTMLSFMLIHPTVWPQYTNVTDKTGPIFFFLGGELGPHLTQCGLGRVYLHAMFHYDPCNRLATTHQRYRQTGEDSGPIA